MLFRSAAVLLRPGRDASDTEMIAHVKEMIGSIKTPKQIQIWTDLPRSKVGKILKTEVRSTMSHSLSKGSTP